MDTFVNTMPLVAGIMMVTFSLIASTSNIPSALLFKAIPFFVGLATIFSGLKLFGIL